MTTAFFSVFDPMELSPCTARRCSSARWPVIPASFALALCALVSALTLYLQHSSA